jgi:o-succinylbenzoate synthase
MGEIAPIAGLSTETISQVEHNLTQLENNGLTYESFVESSLIPSIRMGLEMALLQLKLHEEKNWFPGDFSNGKTSIPINGLVWMNDCESMLRDARELVTKGFKCIKFKVGGQFFEEEVKMLAHFRAAYPPEQIEIRLDANGAFGMDDVVKKLEILSGFVIHSIEQPVLPGNMIELMLLREKIPISIAMDEQLIGVSGFKNKMDLLEKIKPDFIVLKPTLLGGFLACEEWIQLAERLNIRWWITSMLESNVALQAIAEWTSGLNCTIPQGLGTGSLFTNNIPSPLCVEAPVLRSDPTAPIQFNEIFTL